MYTLLFNDSTTYTRLEYVLLQKVITDYDPLSVMMTHIL